MISYIAVLLRSFPKINLLIEFTRVHIRFNICFYILKLILNGDSVYDFIH